MGDRYHSVIPAHDDDENFPEEVTGRLEQRRGRQVKLKPDSQMRGAGTAKFFKEFVLKLRAKTNN